MQPPIVRPQPHSPISQALDTFDLAPSFAERCAAFANDHPALTVFSITAIGCAIGALLGA